MRRLIIIILSVVAISANAQRVSSLKNLNKHKEGWVGTWATAPQVPQGNFMPYNNDMSNRSVRQIVKVSIGGDIIRLQISNEMSKEPLEIKSIYIATAKDSFHIDGKTAKYLNFSGKRAVSIAPGKAVFSDALRFRLSSLQRLAITINYLKAPKKPTVHMGSRTTSYIMRGSTSPGTDFKTSFKDDHWFNISAIDVYDKQSESIAILGNSITDGKNSTTNRQNRWPDIMSDELNAASENINSDAVKNGKTTQNNSNNQQSFGILNLGIGANCVLSTYIGMPGIERFDRDILAQRGIKHIIIFEGINDLGRSKDATATALQLIEAYRNFISKAHARKIKIYGATIMPMKHSGYYSANHEKGRQMVNEWIRTSGEFDGVIDFDEFMRDPFDKESLRPSWQSDWLHPNPEGYKQMGEYAAKRFLEMK